jgi:hypothetical protein
LALARCWPERNNRPIATAVSSIFGLFFLLKGITGFPSCWLPIQSAPSHGTGQMQKENEAMGPVEYLVVEFPGNQFKGEIAPALANLIEKGTIRIIDLLFVKKDAEDNVTAFELSDLADERKPRPSRRWREKSTIC